MDAAGAAVSGIVAAGIMPSAIEMMDRLTIEAAERRSRPATRRARRRAARRARRRRRAGRGRTRRGRADLRRVRRVRDPRATSDADARLLWKGRKSAFAAMGRVATDYYVQDGVVPRTRCPRCSDASRSCREQHGCASATSSTRGRQPPPARALRREAGETERARELAEAILDACLDAGGSLTGEHGVGMDKACSMPRMFSERDLQRFERLRRAFDPAASATRAR
jgi:glycolate oxidase